MQQICSFEPLNEDEDSEDEVGDCNPTPRNVISIKEACLRVGNIFDLWYKKPGELLAIMEKPVPTHPLRHLFEPLHPPQESSAPTAQTYAIGTRVKARVEEGVVLYGADVQHLDDKRVWYHGEIIADNGDGTVELSWDDGLDAGTTKEKNELMFAETQEEHHLDIYTHKTRRKECLYLLFALVGVIAAPGLVSNALKSDKFLPSAKEGDTFQIAIILLSTGDSILWGSVSFGICLLVFFVFAPTTYFLGHLCVPMQAKRMRRLVVTFIDPLSVDGLPNVHGLSESILLVLQASLGLAGVMLGIHHKDAGLLTVFAYLSRSFLKFSNGCMGEATGLQQLRFRHLFSLLSFRLDETKVNLTKIELRLQLEKFLEAPCNAEVMPISLELLTLLASSFYSSKPDSVRLRYFIISDAYRQYRHAVHGLPYIDTTADKSEQRYLQNIRNIVFDSFSMACSVPGINLIGERCSTNNYWLPWHCAIKFSDVQKFEEDLRRMGVSPGQGCFTWRSDSHGRWAHTEAVNPYTVKSKAEEILSEQQAARRDFGAFIIDDGIKDDSFLVKAFLRSSIDPNSNANVNNNEKNHHSLLHIACSSGKLEAAKALIEARADLTCLNKNNKTPLQVGSDERWRISVGLRKCIEDLGIEHVQFNDPAPGRAFVMTGGANEETRGILEGRYHWYCEYYGKAAYKKEGGNVFAYCWDRPDLGRRDFPSGWRLTAQIASRRIWAYHPDKDSDMPPQLGWQIPPDGPVDSTFFVALEDERAAGVDDSL